MSCAAFSLPLPFSPTPAMFEQLRAAVIESGGELHGSMAQGSARFPTLFGTVSGTYAVHGANIVVTILDKPYALSCARIENKMRELISQIPPEVIDTHAETVETSQRPRPPTIDPFVVETTVVSYDFPEGSTVVAAPRRLVVWPLFAFGAFAAALWRWSY